MGGYNGELLFRESAWLVHAEGDYIVQVRLKDRNADTIQQGGRFRK